MNENSRTVKSKYGNDSGCHLPGGKQRRRQDSYKSGPAQCVMEEKINPVNPGIGRHQIADKVVCLPQRKFPASCRFYHSRILIGPFVFRLS